MTARSRPFPGLLPALLSALGLLGFTASGQQPDTLRHSIPAPDELQTRARLGLAAATDGGLVALGAPNDNTGGTSSGAVKVFDAATGNLLHVIPNPTPENNGQFGAALALSGTRLLVGAHGDGTGTSSVGRVYVFELSGAAPGVPVVILENPTPAALDYFGSCLAISGTRIVIGASGDDTGGNAAGIAYVYDLAGASPTVPVVTLNQPTPLGAAQFGRAVAISGTRVIVGTVYAEKAYIYDLSGATPNTPVTTLVGGGSAGTRFFGGAVAISGTTVAVGAYNDGADQVGKVYVYELTSGTPAVPRFVFDNPEPNYNDYFGAAVAISSGRVAVGAPHDDTGAQQAGSVYVYDLASGTPTVPAAILHNPAPNADDFGGDPVAIAGSRVVMGVRGDDTAATDAGSAYVYDLSGGNPTQPVTTLNHPGPAAFDHMGSAVAISGMHVVVGAPHDYGQTVEGGKAYVYDLASAAPTVPRFILANPSVGTVFSFGRAVAISGRRVVIGTLTDAHQGSGQRLGPGPGSNEAAAYLFDLDSATPSVPIPLLRSAVPQAGPSFGSAVGIAGRWVVVGDPTAGVQTGDGGRAYVFDLASATPTVPAYSLINPEPDAGDSFGAAVAIADTRIVVGAHQDDMGATNAGSAYVYDLAGAVPTVPVAALHNPSPAPSAQFGYAVAVSGARVVIGANRDDTGATDAGSAYVYELSGANPTVPEVVLNNPSATLSDYFGYSVAVSGLRVVVGALLDDAGASDAGCAYVYDLSSASPSTPVAILTNPTPTIGDQFGNAVAIHGTTVVIGIPFEDSVMPDKGGAHVFAPANPDYDGDGLLDLWEEARFGSITAHTAADDTDGDGRSELLEQAFDTDPLLSDPPAVLPEVVSEAGFLTITLGKRAGISYTVETAGSPGGAAFSNATTTIITDNASTLKVRDNFTPATAGQRFMRVKVESAP